MSKAGKGTSKLDGSANQSRRHVKATTTFGFAVPKFMKRAENDTGSPKRKSKNEETESSSNNSTPRQPSTAGAETSSSATALGKRSDGVAWKKCNGSRQNAFERLSSPIKSICLLVSNPETAKLPCGEARLAIHQAPISLTMVVPTMVVPVEVDEVTPGAILFHHGVVVHYSDEVAARQAPQVGGMYVFQTNSGHWYIEEGRYFYVLKVFGRHWTECPIYTYEWNGLDGKFEDFKKEHVGLKPMHIAAEKYDPQPHEYRPVHVSFMNDLNEQLSEKAVIHFTEPRSSNCNTRFRVVGYTDGDSVNRIADLRKKMGCV